jgi:hypothetical protein
MIFLKVALLILLAGVFFACGSEFDCFNRTGTLNYILKPTLLPLLKPEKI